MATELERALAQQRKAAREGFDWPDPEGLWAKLQEEIRELRAAVNAAERREELGDLLFMVVNIARHLGIDPAAALQEANRKFERRFAHVMGDHSLPAPGDPRRLAAMEARWQMAKRREHERGDEDTNPT